LWTASISFEWMRHLSFLLVLGCATAPEVASIEAALPDDCHALAPVPSAFVDGTAWVRGSDLMPAWGSYPAAFPELGTDHVQAYAPASAKLTWVVSVPANGVYHFWARTRSIGSYTIEVDDDEVAFDPIVAGDHWLHFGSHTIDAGTRYIDVDIGAGLALDALLITSDASLSPDTSALPAPIAAPVPTVGPRAYRYEDVAAPIVFGTAPRYDETTSDWNVPLGGPHVYLWGARNQRVNASLAYFVNSADETASTTISIPSLSGPVTLTDGIRVRMVLPQWQTSRLWETSTTRPIAQLLAADDSDCTQTNTSGLRAPAAPSDPAATVAHTRLRAGDNRMVWIDVAIPEDAPAGIYDGVVRVEQSSVLAEVPITLLVLDLSLPRDDESVNGAFAPICTDGLPSTVCEPALPHRSAASIASAYRGMQEHGMNAVTLYGGWSMTSEAIASGPPRRAIIMGPFPEAVPPAELRANIDAAHTAGIEEVLFASYDEPTLAQVPDILGFAAYRHAPPAPLAPMALFQTINNYYVWLALQDAVDHPVLNLMVFGHSCFPMHTRSLTFTGLESVPMAYWGTGASFPHLQRAFSGLYLRALGYRGGVPWAYEDEVAHNSLAIPGHDVDQSPLATRNYEALRAGLDDVRYLLALDELIAKAQSVLPANPGLAEPLASARAARREAYECIIYQGECPLDATVPPSDCTAAEVPPHFYALGLYHEDLLEKQRWLLAEAALLLAAAL
jgi:hypothetical protein